VDVVFQFDLAGQGGGKWYVTVKDKKCSVSEGEHGNPTTTITMDTSDFVALIQGKLDAMQAFTSGRLKVGGDMMKSRLIQKLFSF
ncbi:MAG: short-chain dehydrogenase, partial [Deltaproteobacteria bacterium]